MSDDFNGTALNTSLWTFSAPAGGTVSVSNGHAYLAVPGGANHDPAAGGADNAVRIMQSIANQNFDVAAKFDSTPTALYEGEGILVQQDSTNYLRFEFGYHGSGEISVFANSITAGTETSRISTSFSAGAASLWLQVQRTSNSWELSYSTNGTTYTQVGNFSDTLTISQIGVYAGNYSSTSGNAPAFTAAVDYFYNLPAAAGPPVSDDFNGTTLNTSLWTIAAPAGGTVSVSNGHAYLAAPAGSDHDAFSSGDSALRIMQTIANQNFDVSAKFDSTPTALYQGEGILVQQSSGTYLRIEFGYYSSGVVGVFANSIDAGVQTGELFSTFSPGTASLWLQVQRTGNTWVVSYSTNGTAYTQLGNFSYTMSVSEIGVYADNWAANASQAPAFTAAVDYFYNLSTTTTGTVATPTFSPVSGTTFSSTLSVDIADSTSGATIYYTTDGSTPTTTSPIYTTPLTITKSTTVNAFATDTAAGDNPSSLASATYTLSAGTSGAPVSDDFNGTSLNTSLWTATTPSSSTVTVSNGHAYLAATAGSDHDAFTNGNGTVRIMQPISNANFNVAAKFDSAPSVLYQAEGILVQQDSGTYLRIEIGYHGSGSTAAYANAISGGVETGEVFSSFPSGAASYWLQVQRTGNSWIISYSTNGTTYTEVGSFSYTLNVSSIGVYADNWAATASQAPAFTAAVDYFYNLGATTSPPAISGVSANPTSTAAAITWATNEAATSEVEYGTTPSYGFSSSNSSLVTAHSIVLSNLTCNTTYDYEVISANSSGQSSSSSNATFLTGTCSTGGGGPVSDNFDAAALNSSLWTLVNPFKDAVLTMNGSAANITIPWGTDHQSSTAGNNSVRLLQTVSNANLEVQTRFQSMVEIPTQEEGIFVQQDASDFLKFGVFNAGTSIQLYALGVNGSTGTTFVNSAINVTQAPIWLQLQRSGNSWTAQWSTDGVNFSTGATFNFALNVSSIGPYAANYNSTVEYAPAFTAIVDYFFNVASPVSNNDGPPPFLAITVDPNAGEPLVEKALADIQGTGHLDPVIGMEYPSGGGIYWYEYPASGVLTDTWHRYTIVNDGNAYEDMMPLDVNNDGAVDIVASYEPPGSGAYSIVWFENPAGSGGDPRTTPWTMHVIGPGAGEDNLVIADFDGDGKPDIATSYYIYFQNSADSWTAVQYNSAMRGIGLLDIGSGKGSINLVSSQPTDTTTYNVAWFENPRETGGNARTGQWVAHVIGPSYTCNTSNCPGGDYSVAAYNTGDFNGDGRMDIVMGQSEGILNIPPPPGGLVWFEAPTDRINGTWTRHTVDSTFEDSHCVRVADMDHNGTLDLVSSEQDQSIQRRVSVFYNDGNGNFTEQIIGNGAGHQTTIGDAVGNGGIDVLNSAHGYGALVNPNPLILFINPIK